MPAHSTASGIELHEDKRIKQDVRAASTATVTLALPGASLDGITLVSGDRILLKNQSAPAENGIYVWTSGVTALARATDADAAVLFVPGFKVFVREGTSNAATYWTLTTSGTITLGSTSLAFARDGSSTGEITGTDFAPTGLTGATSASRYVGATTSGAPVSGTFVVGDYVIDRSGVLWICTVAGSPGTWVSAGFQNPMTTVGDLIVGAASGAPARLASGTTTYVLTSNGVAATPSWQVPSGGGGGAGTTGYQFQQTRIDNTTNKTTTSTSFVVIDNTNLPPLSVNMQTGGVAKLLLTGETYNTSTNTTMFDWQVVQPTMGTTRVYNSTDNGAALIQGNTRLTVTAVATFVAAEPGVHTFQPFWRVSAGTATLSNAISGLDDTEILHAVEVFGSIPYASIQDQKSIGTAGGTFTSGAWQTRTLNTTVSDTAVISSLSANAISLASGTYRIRAEAPASHVDSHQTRLRNTTDSTTTLTGTTALADATVSTVTTSVIAGTFVITGTKVFEVQHQCQTTRASTGFGVAANFGTEVYTTVEIWKEA